MSIDQLYPYAALGLWFVIGFLAGALWQSKLHLADLRRHNRWVEEYTAAVTKLLEEQRP